VAKAGETKVRAFVESNGEGFLHMIVILSEAKNFASITLTREFD